MFFSDGDSDAEYEEHRGGRFVGATKYSYSGEAITVVRGEIPKLLTVSCCGSWIPSQVGAIVPLDTEGRFTIHPIMAHDCEKILGHGASDAIIFDEGEHEISLERFTESHRADCRYWKDVVYEAHPVADGYEIRPTALSPPAPDAK